MIGTRSQTTLEWWSFIAPHRARQEKLVVNGGSGPNLHDFLYASVCEEKMFFTFSEDSLGNPMGHNEFVELSETFYGEWNIHCIFLQNSPLVWEFFGEHFAFVENFLRSYQFQFSA